MQEQLPPQEAVERENWLTQRRTGIGGSDAAAVIGVSPWKSPLSLWAEKSGLVDEPNLDELERIEWGRVLEEPIARKYAQVTGRSLVDPGRYAIRHHPDVAFMHCTVDREICEHETSNSGNGDLSIKNVGAFVAADWDVEPPLQYQVQLQHELAVTGMQWGAFAVLIGGQKFYQRDVARDDRFIDWLMAKEAEFWARVTDNNPPPPDATDSTRELLLRLYPKDTGATVDLPEEFDAIAVRRAELKQRVKDDEAELLGIDNQIKAALGDATIGLLSDGSGFSWKQQHRNEYTVEACDYRVLRIVKARKGQR